jgi:hypothetical protein
MHGTKIDIAAQRGHGRSANTLGIYKCPGKKRIWESAGTRQSVNEGVAGGGMLTHVVPLEHVLTFESKGF